MVDFHHIIATIHGDIREAGSSVSYLIAPPLTLRKIVDFYPYSPRPFIFRCRVFGSSIGFQNAEYFWLDLTELDKPITFYKIGEPVQLRAVYSNNLMTSIDEDVYDSFETYRSEILNQYPNVRPSRYPVLGQDDSIGHIGKSILHKIKSGVKKAQEAATSDLTFKTVKQGASTVWNTLKTTMTQIGIAGTSVLSDNAEENLSKLSDFLSSMFSDSNSEHVKLLKDLWIGLFSSSENYQRQSPKWKEAGFQQSDPVADLKTSGVLALTTMSYMCKNYPEKSKAMLLANKENTKTKYPFAVVGVNVTLLLSEVLNLRDQRYLSSTAGYWEMFESSTAFYEIFCITFFHIDNTWTSTGAVRADFGKIIGEAKAKISTILAQSPKSLTDFRNIARDSDIHVI